MDYLNPPSIGMPVTRIFAFLFATLAALPALAEELVMVEQDGCHWCEQWHEDIGPIFPKTTEGKFAPLRRIDIHDTLPSDLTFQSDPVFTPTFVLIRDGVEIGRIEGYPGEDFFWGLLGQMLRAETDYTGETS